MEIRTYWLIASLDPFIVLYHDGTVRLTTGDYKHGDWDNALIHITNTYQQKQADTKFWDTVTDRKWSLEQLENYLKQENKVPSTQNWIEEFLRPTLKSYIRTVALAAHQDLKDFGTKKKPADFGRFELLGMDVIFDDTLRPYLTEVQSGPGLSRDPGVKATLIPEMLEEMFSIILEVDESKKHKLPLSANKLRNLRSWEVVDVE